MYGRNWKTQATLVGVIRGVPNVLGTSAERIH